MQIKIDNKKESSKIGVVGLGYVGVPFFIEFAKKNLEVIGFDTDQKKIKSIRNGDNYLPHISQKEFKNLKNYRATEMIEELKECKTIIICLPTPIKTADNTPDLRYIKSFFKNAENILQKNSLIILVSTVYTGFTREIIGSYLINAGFKIGKNIFLCFSPERENPGSNDFNISNTPRLISGFTKNCVKRGEKVLKKITKKIKIVDSLEIAETSKLIENAFRLVNISFVNEMKEYCDSINLNINSVLNAAATKPFGFMKFSPGPGIGGHCIPVDPHYLLWKANKKNIDCSITKQSLIKNNQIQNWTIKKIRNHLKEKYSSKNLSLLVVGISYKKNINDIRHSPSLEIMNKLSLKYKKVDYHDNYVKSIILNKSNNKKKSIKIDKNISKYSAIIILTDHDYINYNFFINNSKLIFDTRNIFKKNLPNIIKI